MDKLLLRQLRKTLGVDDEAAVAALLESAATAADSADPALRGLLSGFGNLLQRVEATYQQYERDLELRARSLELSSAELSAANEQLRQSLANRERALRSLRETVRDLLPGDPDTAESLADEDIATLSEHIAARVAEGEHDRRELANQKFALDQHAIVTTTDTAGNIIYANDRFCEISGYSRDEVIGQSHRIVNSGVHPPAMFEEMWRTISQGEVWRGEICNRTRNGGHYWVNATIVPLLGADGLPASYIAIRTDITDRKVIEGQLSEQLHLVEELIETIPLPIYFKDPEGRYVRLNRAFEEFFQVRREDMLGHTLLDLLPPEDAAVHVQKDLELFARRGMQSYEASVHSRDGRRHDALYRKAVLTRRDGSVSGLLGVIVDITERKQAEAEVMRAKEAAEAASRAKSDFLANMSHEIRTPMNGIIGMSDLALDTELTQEQREYLSIVKSSAESLLTIINDILDFSKIEAGKLQVEHIGFDLRRVIADTLKPLALRAHEKELELVSEILPGVPHHVLGDPGRLRQVLVNLVGNAIKFTKRGEITVRADLQRATDGFAVLHVAVSDTGIGIAPEKQDLIFDAFAQEDTSTTRNYGGTGLGLSISRRLVELMGGRIWLDSEPGVGSTFHFTVQLQLATAQPPLRPISADLRGRRFLIVDDNATNRRVLTGMLHNWGAEAEAVDGGRAALERMARGDGPLDCIILDAQMPEIDGYELARRLRAELPAVPPMLMLSSGAVRGDAQRCQDVGISGFFAKPISSEELLAALGSLFAGAGGTPGVAPSLVTRFSLRETMPSLDVLLAEDHPTNQKLALGLLDKWGHRATLASNGREAVDLWSDGSFDVILMDMQMPVMGGIEATRLIRADEAARALPRTPIIAMTAAAMEDDRAACLAAGMDDYIAKPIKVRELQEKLLGIARRQ